MVEPKNILIEIAKKHGRTYVTPEDVGEAKKRYTIDKVRLHLLRCMGGEAGCEDSSLCAFIAANSKS